MHHQPGKHNRGPAAAADNRRAILAAARLVFAEHGLRAPLSAVAKQAGVGQGVLYRHFRTRLDLAFATFETHWDELERLSRDPGPDALQRLWTRLIDLTIEEAAFIELLVEARRSHQSYDAANRMQDLLEAPLRRAIEAGRVDPRLTTDDLMLGPRIAYGIVTTATETTGIRDAVAQALAIGDRLPALSPPAA